VFEREKMIKKWFRGMAIGGVGRNGLWLGIDDIYITTTLVV
jgi:hypothetical protein